MHHNWLTRANSEYTDYPEYFEKMKDVVTQEAWRRNYADLHPLSQSQVREWVASRYCKEVLGQ